MRCTRRRLQPLARDARHEHVAGGLRHGGVRQRSFGHGRRHEERLETSLGGGDGVVDRGMHDPRQHLGARRRPAPRRDRLFGNQAPVGDGVVGRSADPALARTRGLRLRLLPLGLQSRDGTRPRLLHSSSIPRWAPDASQGGAGPHAPTLGPFAANANRARLHVGRVLAHPSAEGCARRRSTTRRPCSSRGPGPGSRRRRSASRGSLRSRPRATAPRRPAPGAR